LHNSLSEKAISNLLFVPEFRRCSELISRILANRGYAFPHEIKTEISPPHGELGRISDLGWDMSK
jgi:hypothetical protein